MEEPLQRLRPWFAALVLMVAACPPGHAESEKNPVRFIVGVPAGGSIDLLARQLAEKMKDILGEPVLVENQAGANQRIALAEVRKSPPDARTLYIGTSGLFSILPNIYGDKLDYDPVKDFTPIARLVHFDIAIGVGPATPAQNLPELIAWLRANPQKASYGTPGAGTTSHFVGLMFASSLATPLIHVPYKGGTPAINDLVGGHIPMLINSLADMLEQHKAGNLRIVAATGPKRSALLPEVPTLKESGVDVAVDIAIDVYGSGNAPRRRAFAHSGLRPVAGALERGRTRAKADRGDQALGSADQGERLHGRIEPDPEKLQTFRTRSCLNKN
jgi:tripartite-type tricarboxylate transporter receptor subunit TctC